MKPKFINSNDFLAYWGLNLEDKLRDDDNPSNKANTFLFRVEQRLMAWIDKNTFRVVDYNHLTPYQLEKFRFALLEQAMYMWRNGDLGQDSGYDQEKGIIVSADTLEEISVCKPALNYIVVSGIYNQKIQNRRRYMTGDAFGYIEKTNKETFR